MNIVKINLAGEERLLCYSTAADLVINERFGSLTAWGKELGHKDMGKRLAALFAMAQILMDAGTRYDEACNLTPHTPLAADVMPDLLDSRDALELQRAVMDALTRGQTRTVGAEPPKNAQTTPGAAAT